MHYSQPAQDGKLKVEELYRTGKFFCSEAVFLVANEFLGCSPCSRLLGFISEGYFIHDTSLMKGFLLPITTLKQGVNPNIFCQMKGGASHVVMWRRFWFFSDIDYSCGSRSRVCGF